MQLGKEYIQPLLEDPSASVALEALGLIQHSPDCDELTALASTIAAASEDGAFKEEVALLGVVLGQAQTV